jgi:hypothetical protein
MHIIPTSVDKLMVTSKGEDQGFDIDHIFPKDDALKFLWKQSKAKDQKFGNTNRAAQSIGSIGNLVLLHEVDNRSQGNALPSDEEKINNLGASELYLNRLLTEKSKWEAFEKGKREQLDKLFDSLGVGLADWNEDAVDKLASFYWSILLTELKSNLLIS